MIAAVVAVAAILTVAGLGAGKFYDRKISNFNGEKTIFVTSETTVDDIEKSLSDVVRHKESLHRELSRIDTLVEGAYRVDRNYSSAYLARCVSHGWQTPVTLVIGGNIKTKEELARVISKQLRISCKSMMDALKDRDMDFIIPDSYSVYWTASADEIFATLKKYYDRFWTSERLSLAHDVRLSTHEAYILASIVAMETHIPSEYPLIACVYENRLRKGMPLQACPTVCYIYNYELKRVLKSHLKTRSPYNTYINRGLPPGPICIPPKACIDAVLNPADENYLYFSASPSLDGTNRFTASFSEHIRLSAQYKERLDSLEANR